MLYDCTHSCAQFLSCAQSRTQESKETRLSSDSKTTRSSAPSDEADQIFQPTLGLAELAEGSGRATAGGARRAFEADSSVSTGNINSFFSTNIGMEGAAATGGAAPGARGSTHSAASYESARSAGTAASAAEEGAGKKRGAWGGNRKLVSGGTFCGKICFVVENFH